ncbi:MAG: hypothetical protein HF314_15330 [Ignavibacteria bacterium]|jgi:drug/metabolite transporter superfamily protein YnfA|nr:hypothetical protein [Ignavibacteria bacterium]MCU7504452.1 hypothetical protein [Ignavibacteria bacterium]MCU7517457.1 hypothetical protein [Ignavibacteria bacterium]
MFIGHYGAALAAKKFDARPSLGTMFLASQFLDLLWPALLFLGVEKVSVEPGNSAFTPLNFVYYPFSHSLFFTLIWAVIFGVFYYLKAKNLRSSFLLGILVLSHWVLDLLTHVPDLPLYPGSSIKLGLGLWNFVSLTVLVEGLIFIVGAFLYIASTKAENKKGSILLWSLLALLAVIYVSGMLAPPPPSAGTMVFSGIYQCLFIAWGYFIDRNRKPVTLAQPVMAEEH